MSLIGHSGARCDTRRRFAVVAVAVLAMLLLIEPFVAPAVAGGKGSSGDRSASADGRGKGGKSDKDKSDKDKSDKGKEDDRGKSGKGPSGKGKDNDRGKSEKGKSEKGKDDDQGKNEKGKSDKGKSEKGKHDDQGKSGKDKDKDRDKSEKDKSGKDKDKDRDKSGKGKDNGKDKPRDDRDDGAQGGATGSAPHPPAGDEAPAPPPADRGGPPDPDPQVSGNGSAAGLMGIDGQGRTEVANLDVLRAERLALQTPAAPPAGSSPGAGVTAGSAADGISELTGPQVAARAVLASPPLPLLIRPRPHVQAGVIESSREVAVEVGRDLTEHPEFPLVLMLAAGLFLLLQHRLDRNEPKLTAAPAHQSVLEFQPLPQDCDS